MWITDLLDWECHIDFLEATLPMCPIPAYPILLPKAPECYVQWTDDPQQLYGTSLHFVPDPGDGRDWGTLWCGACGSPSKITPSGCVGMKTLFLQWWLSERNLRRLHAETHERGRAQGGFLVLFGVQSKISFLSRAVNLGPEKKLPEGLLISKLRAACRSWGSARALSRFSRLEIFLRTE